jgi:DNA-binding MarR family transcriptional regulator
MDERKMQELSEKILVYLLENQTTLESYEAPDKLTTTSMARRLKENPNRLSILLNKLVQKRLVHSEEHFVVGYSTKKEVYSLTPYGISKAKAMVSLKKDEKESDGNN